MASVDCKPHGYTACTNARRQTEEELDRAQDLGELITGICLLVFIALCVAGLIIRRICRKDPKANNDIELAVVPQQDTPGPAVPQPVANPGRPRSISAAPPPYRTPRCNSAKEDPAVDGMENIDLKN